MELNVSAWQQDAADLRREETKRKASPPSFFFSQGHALVLAAGYFTDDRLEGGYTAVARKHLHRIHLALYGQLLASLEYLFKDFIAQVIDLVPTFDEKIAASKWIGLQAEHILSARSAPSTPGAILLHPTMGWHEPEKVNERFSSLFGYAPIDAAEIPTLRRLWILRHSVAHNAGFVTNYDAVRAQLPGLSSKVADINGEQIQETFGFLCEIARRLAEKVGHRVVVEWLKTRVPQGPDYNRDKVVYKALKLIGTFVESRAQPLPSITKGSYTSDFAEAEAAA